MFQNGLPLLEMLLAGSLTSFLTWLLTLKYAVKTSKESANSLEIETCMKKIDAYDKIIDSLNNRVNQYREENDGLREDVQRLRTEIKTLKKLIEK